MKIELEKLTIELAHKHLIGGDFSAVEFAQAYLDEIAKKNQDLNAYLEIYDDVLSQAKHADSLIANKNATKLTGIPLAIKDNILIKGKIASSASKMLENYRATYDATVISKLKNEGVVFLGRTNMDEFAMGSSTENSAYGVSKNPHDLTKVPGGSSGGSAVAVAGNIALGSLGSDTGGSIRQPASLCGVVGLKTTYGAVSRFGLMAMGSSLDQIGPITKTVTDAEIIFNAIKGLDVLDSTTYKDGTYPISQKKKYTVGVPKGLLEQKGLHPNVVSNFKESLEKIKSLGYDMQEIEMPDMSHALAVYYILMPAEVSSNLARFDGVKYGFHKEGKDLLEDYVLTRREGFGKEVRRRILLGTYVLSTGYYDAYYNKAIALKNDMTARFKKLFESVDVILTPTTPTPAFKIGEKTNDPLEMYLADIFTVTANIVGIPALSVPSGFAHVLGKKLPLGIQFMAPHGGEAYLFEVGKRFLGEK